MIARFSTHTKSTLRRRRGESGGSKSDIRIEEERGREIGERKNQLFPSDVLIQFISY